MNQSKKPAPVEIGKRGVTRLEIHLPKRGEFTIEAVLMNAADQVVEGLRANDDDAIVEHLMDNFAIPTTTIRDAISFRRNYEKRLLAAEQFNEEQSKLYGGLMQEFTAGNTNYSIVGHAAYRVAQPNDPDITTDQYYEVFAQDTRESDPDKAYIDSKPCDSLYECIVWMRNLIERDLIDVFADGTITL